MAHWYKFVSSFLWAAPHVLLAGVPVLTYVRRLHKRFPLFFLYTLYETFQFLLLFGIRIFAPTHGTLYLYVFTATLAGSAALRFGIIEEILNNVFQSYPRLERIATVSMRWLTGLLVISAILSVVYSSGAASEHWMAGIAFLNRSVALVQAGLLLFLFLFSSMFGLSWRTFAFGIALGFGILASTDLAVWSLRLADSDGPFVRLLNLLLTGSYHVSVLVWLGYLLKAEMPVEIMSHGVAELDQWSGELERTR